MSPKSQRARFASHFRTVGTADRARNEKAYLKSDLSFYGVALPEIRKAAKDFRKAHRDLSRNDLAQLVRCLWESRYHELRMLGIALLELYAELLVAADMALIEELLRRSNTWAQADWLAKVAGSIVARSAAAKRQLARWAKDDNLWVRRSAMLALQPQKSEGDFELFARFASAMIEEPEFFIRKAIGWVLRETSKHRPELVHAFLLEHIDRVSGLTLREGSKYLPKGQKAQLLRRYHARS